MSSFYEDASLVMIPSGYKTSKVYSAKPTDGTGDLSFTRSNDTATRVGPDGLIEKVRTNLLLQSNSFDTTWAYINTSVTSGQSGYDGSSDAWKLENTDTNGSIIQYIAPSGVHTLSVYAKAGNVDWIRLRFVDAGDNNVWVNLSTGTAATPTGGISASVTSVGGGWYRIEFAVNCSSVTQVRFYTATTNGSNASTGDYVYIQAAQLEAGDIATDYIATTTAAVSVGPVANVPRLDYLGSTCPRLLLEPQRTNALQFSESLNTAPNVVDASTFTANVYTSPDGNQNADQFTETTANDRHGFYQYSTVTTQAYTASIFTKQTGRRYIAFLSDITGTQVSSFFDLQTESVLTSGSGHTCSVQDYGNGWLRLIVSFTASAGSRFLIWGGSIDGTNATYVGSASFSQTFWGVQLEAGAYATSYIGPTLGAGVTRGADDCVKTSATSIIGQTEGVVYFEWEYQNVGSNGGNIVISLDATGSSDEIYFWVQTNGNYRFDVGYSGSGVVGIIGSMGSFGTKKIALAYKNNDFALYINGVLAGTDTSGTVPTCNRLYVGRYYANTAYNIASGIKQVLLFKTRLSNDSLAELTSL
jgi:hypothetical protein